MQRSQAALGQRTSEALTPLGSSNGEVLEITAPAIMAAPRRLRIAVKLQTAKGRLGSAIYLVFVHQDCTHRQALIRGDGQEQRGTVSCEVYNAISALEKHWAGSSCTRREERGSGSKPCNAKRSGWRKRS